MAQELQRLGEICDFPFHLVLGGLRPGTTQELQDEEREHIKHHWLEVTRRTGQPITFDLLENKVPFIYDTEVPCRAVVTVRGIDPQKSFPFFKAVQRGFYVENRDTNEIAFYEPLLAALSIDVDQFRERFYSEEVKKETNDDFMWCRQVGVHSFPTVILYDNDQLYALAIGYATYHELIARMKGIMQKD